MANKELSEIDMYETVCKDRFDAMDASQKEVIGILRGHNGDPGLLHTVREMKLAYEKTYRRVAAVFVFIGVTVGAQVIHVIWNFASKLFT